MKPNIYLLVVCVCILAGFLTACGENPQEALNGWQEAINTGDVDHALSFLADDATVTIVPAFDGDGIYEGHTEIRGWYEILASGKGTGTLSECNVQGNTITCLNTYTDEGLKSMGVDFLESDFVAVVQNGIIQSYTVTARPESLEKFPPSEPTPISEVRLTELEKLVGKWEGAYQGYVVLHDFRPDGTMLVNVSDVGLISRSKYWFEEDVLQIEDTTGDCMGIVGSYEVYAAYQGDEVVELRFFLVGEDQCSDRRGTLAGKTLIRR